MNVAKKIASVLFLVFGLAVFAYLILLFGSIGYRDIGGLVRVGTLPFGLATVLFWSAGKLGYFPRISKIILLCLAFIVVVGCLLSIVASGGRIFMRPFLLIVTLLNGYILFDLIKSMRNYKTKFKSGAING